MAKANGQSKVSVKLRELIESGRFDAGNGRLPSFFDLAQMLLASKNTVVNAVDDLKALGIIKSIPRVGLFVANRSSPQSTLSEHSCCKDINYWPGLGTICEKFALTPEWHASLQGQLRHADALTYLNLSHFNGECGLRELVAANLRPPGVGSLDPENSIILPGAASGIALACYYAIRGKKNGRVALESPSQLQIMRNEPLWAGIEFCSIPRKAGKLDLQVLRQEFSKGCSAFVVTPHLQNPLGCTLSLSERFEIAALAKQYNVFLIEDDPAYLYLREADRIPSFYSLCPENTVFISSLSKYLGGGLKLGYMFCSQDMLNWYKNRSCLPISCYLPVFSQKLVAEFLKRGAFFKHLENLRDNLARNAKLGEVIFKILPGEWGEWHGGLFRQFIFNNNLNMEALSKKMRQDGVFMRPDACFYGIKGEEAQVVNKNWVRINLSHCSDGVFADIAPIILKNL